MAISTGVGILIFFNNKAFPKVKKRNQIKKDQFRFELVFCYLLCPGAYRFALLSPFNFLACPGGSFLAL
jgi:hypothetical protein